LQVAVAARRLLGGLLWRLRIAALLVRIGFHWRDEVCSAGGGGRRLWREWFRVEGGLHRCAKRTNEFPRPRRRHRRILEVGGQVPGAGQVIADAVLESLDPPFPVAAGNADPPSLAALFS